ncbi:MAG: hypothetical protein GVY07_06240 [Bacteroidetes bacterium]|nr:hypothetical protein [Bacteroidota bacterium]
MAILTGIKLDFRDEWFWDDPPRFCILDRDGFGLMLSRVDGIKDIKLNYKIVQIMWNVDFWVDDAAKMYEEMKASGAIIDYHLGEKDYGCLQFGIQDLDG